MPSKNPSKNHLLVENLLRTLLRIACGCMTPLVCALAQHGRVCCLSSHQLHKIILGEFMSQQLHHFAVIAHENDIGIFADRTNAHQGHVPLLCASCDALGRCEGRLWNAQWQRTIVDLEESPCRRRGEANQKCASDPRPPTYKAKI